MTKVNWRKSSFCGDSTCVEFAALADGNVAVRDSKDPDGSMLVFSRGEIDAMVKGAKSGEFDDLTV